MKVLPETPNDAGVWILIGIGCMIAAYLRYGPIIWMLGWVIVAVGVVTGLILWAKQLPGKTSDR